VKINATEAALHAVAEALQLAALLDDRAPKADKGRIGAWAEQLQRHNFTDTDLRGGILLDVVQNYYDHPSERPIGIGDLVDRAITIREDRYKRRDLEQIEADNDEMDARLATVINEVADAKSIPDDDLKFRRPTFNPLRVPCTYCHAPIARPCVSASTKQPMRLGQRYHPARIDVAKGAPPHDYDAPTDPTCDTCGRPLIDPESAQRGTRKACGRCQPVVDGPLFVVSDLQSHPNGDRGTA
jgi:hypothetical protein